MGRTGRSGDAIRIEVRGADDVATLPDRVLRDAGALGLSGWVRAGDPAHLRSPGESGDGSVVRVHAEGDADALAALTDELRAVPGAGVEIQRADVEGHEQFAVRGVIAGAFVVQEHRATAHHFDLRLQVGDVMRSWAVPKGPSLDPAVKRFAVQVGDHDLAHNEFEGATPGGGVIIWDRGGYEQGGRVGWPAALERGHAVFVLHGEKLRGGFALQRTGPAHGERPARWLLLKRRDAEARPGSEVAAELPRSVLSGLTLDELIAGG